jgi:hypothetical protein
VIELTRFANAWWMATGTPGGSDVVMWKGTDDGLWDVMEGWPSEGDTYGGMATGPWMLNDTLGRSPGMIVSSWYLALGIDEEGNAKTEQVQVGETEKEYAKGIKEGKLIPILVKALQEAVERIETLEAKVAALEANNGV